MRIITLTAENVKRLRAVEITPSGDVVVIAGKNAQGKTSVLDAIWLALAGGAASKETTRPIRDGEEQASVRLDLGDLIVERRWSVGGTVLNVTTSDGATYKSPQTLLDSLIGRLTFDPLAFAGQDQKGQLATLLSIVELPFNLDELERDRAGTFDRRTDVNRDVKRLEAQLAAVPEPGEDTPDEEVSAAGLAAELQVAQEEAGARLAAENELQSARRQVTEAETALEQARLALEGAHDREARAKEVIEDLPTPTDPEPIRQRLAELDTTNAAVRAKQQRARITGELETARKASGDLTRSLDAIADRKAKATAEAAMPLEGLSFDEDGVIYQGVPFAQCSAAERLRVSIAIAMALNPKIRVIRITDGSLLDTENLALIEQMAGEHDFQVWIERVDETGTVGITIEDGAVVGAEEVTV
jgi:DNA repair exonuclease SbcCD ATPase subunit